MEGNGAKGMRAMEEYGAAWDEDNGGVWGIVLAGITSYRA